MHPTWVGHAYQHTCFNNTHIPCMLRACNMHVSPNIHVIACNMHVTCSLFLIGYTFEFQGAYLYNRLPQLQLQIFLLSSQYMSQFYITIVLSLFVVSYHFPSITCMYTIVRQDPHNTYTLCRRGIFLLKWMLRILQLLPTCIHGCGQFRTDTLAHLWF